MYASRRGLRPQGSVRGEASVKAHRGRCSSILMRSTYGAAKPRLTSGGKAEAVAN